MNATRNKMTHIQSRRDAAERCMRRITHLLHWSDERYCWFKYETGLQYLAAYLRGDVEAQDWISRSKVFWGWWKNHWTIREEAFLQDADLLERLNLLTRVKAYTAMHNANALASEMHPNAKVLEESYDAMIQEMLKKEIA